MLISNKLISLLKTFSKHDLNRFEKYLASPFFNESDDIISLFFIMNKYLRTNNNTLDLKDLGKEKIWTYIYKNKKYNDVKMRRLSSDLTKLVLSFLAYRNYNSLPQNELPYLLNALNKPGLQKHYENTLIRANLLLQKSKHQDSNFHYNQFIIEQSKYDFKDNTKDNLVKGLERSDYQLDCFYFSNKLKNLSDAISQEYSFSNEVNLKSIPNLLDYLKNNGYTKVPAIKVYFLILKMLTTSEGETFFFQLKDFIYQYADYFSKQELNTVFIHLQNYCIVKKMNIGERGFQYELFSLYKTSLENEIILDKNSLNYHHYKNIITIGLLVKEYQWVENFIQTFTKNIPKEKRINALTYNLSKVYFSQKKYNKVIEHLQSVAYKNHVYALGGKLILLKTYYELKEYIALDSLIDSFRIYIRRNKIISREVKQQYLNVLRFVKKLSSTMPGNKKSIDKIKSQIDKCKALADKKWILEKVEELS